MKPTYESLTLSKVGTTRERRCFFGGGGVCQNTYHHNTKAMLCMECTQDPQIEGSKRYYYNLLTGGKEYFVKRGNSQTPRPGRIPGELLFEPNVLSGVVSSMINVMESSRNYVSSEKGKQKAKEYCTMKKKEGHEARVSEMKQYYESGSAASYYPVSDHVTVKFLSFESIYENSQVSQCSLLLILS